MSNQKIDQDQREKIVSLYTGGLSAEMVGKRFGISAAHVRKIAKKAKDER